MDLLERAPYLTALGDHLRQAGAGRGVLVLLGGEAGVGKTSLVRRFREDVPPDVRVLAGSCDPISTPRPLGPLLDIAATVGGRFERLTLEATPRHRLFSAFLVELDRQPTPVMTVLEDMHWADEASLDLLRFLGRRLGQVRALVIATYRDDEVGPDHPLRHAIGDLATSVSVRRMQLPPLSPDAVRTLCQDSSLDPEALHRQTGGNPFFVTEALAAGAGVIPITVRDAVLARAARLSERGRAALDAAAVIGASIEPWLLATVVDSACDAVDECIARGVLRVAGNDLAFRHELARQALLEAIAPTRRLELHTRVLAALRSAPAPDPARLAHHAEEAADRDAVLSYAPVAAARAAALRSHREARDQYARVLRFADGLPPEQHAVFLDAHSYECYVTDHLSEGITTGKAAMEEWRRAGDRLNEGNATRRLSRLLRFSGRNAEAEVAASAAIDVLEKLPPGYELAMAYSNVALLRLLAWDSHEAIVWGEKAIVLSERLGETEALVHALLNVGLAGLIDDVDSEQARGQCERSLRLARENDLMDHAAGAYAGLAASYGEAYQYDRANAYLAEGTAYCTEHDLEHMVPYLLTWRAMSHAFQGHWAEATETALSVVRQPTVWRAGRIVALVVLGRVRARQGEATANVALDEALALVTQRGELQRLCLVRAARAEAAWLAGDHEGVSAEVQSLFELAVRHGQNRLSSELAFWLWRIGELKTPPADMLEPFALQIAGNWEAAAACWQALGCPYEAAWALADGDESSLRTAHAEFVRLGAAPAARIVTQRLRELGVSRIPRGPRPTTQVNPAHLTPREMQILALIAEELTNAEIAKRVYLSPRTVAHHVSSILTKLGVHSRSHAVQAAARLGIPGQNGQVTSPK